MKKFYVTTPIYYVNDVASIGHAYTTISADVLARWYRLKGYKVFFLTGLDENSKKTIDAAKKQGISDIKSYTDMMAEKWKSVWTGLNISNDDFIRTTEKRHEKLVKEFFMKVYKKGDVYKGKYEGLYCEGCEDFVKESDLVDGKCQYHKTEPKKITEENYFFKLSKYEKRVLDYIKKHPEFIGPGYRKNEVISFVKSGLRDISISRPNNGWGIEVTIDKRQVYWTWFDALLNYVSGARNYWPADLHLMAKDIIKFHGVIFPAMLMSAGYKLPKQVYAHGFLTVNGQKMSKSLGNAIDPLYLSQKYGVDQLRYFLLREIPFGEDGDFSEDALVSRINNELANDLGNLLNRTVVMINSYLGGNIPKKTKDEVSKHLDLKKIDSCMEKRELHNALNEIWKFINFTNKYINDKQPWGIKDKKQLDAVLYNLAESLRFIAILLKPFMPQTSGEIALQLGIKDFGKQGFKHLKFGLLKGRVSKPSILFKKIEVDVNKSGGQKMENTFVEFSDWKKLDIRTGTIKKAAPHPNADKLVVLQVDIGEAKERQLVAGLRQHYKVEDLVGKKVVVFANLKPVSLRGVDSNGMVLAAGKGNEVFLLTTDKPIGNGARIE